MQNDTDIGILCLAPEPWGGHWMSRHQIMSRLARHYKILWVSPPVSWRRVIGRGSSKISARGFKKITQSFWAYAPERYLPAISRIKIIGDFFFRCRVSKIKSLLAAMGVKRKILSIWRPEFGSYIGCFNEELTCYHVVDEYTFSEIDLPITQKEERLLKRSDIVFISSRTLLEKKGMLNPATYYLPNGVDFNHYRAVMQNINDHPPEFESIPRPRIGYIGYIKKQLDLGLLFQIAEKRKDWSFVLVGPINKGHRSIRKDIELLKGENNVYFLGAKKPEDLPMYIKEMDVCLMNYRKTEYTQYIYPLKLHEYLSCGKPVVATCLANLEEFDEVLYFAEGFEDWIYKIQFALNESDPEMNWRRIELAEENSWDVRVETIKSIFQAKLERQEKHSLPIDTHRYKFETRKVTKEGVNRIALGTRYKVKGQGIKDL
jgi:glycosyltransferase involved in cell wall biosynthesis